MPCSSKSVQEHLPPVSLLLNGGSFDQNEEYDGEFNEMVKEAKRKVVKEKRKISFWWATGFSKTTDRHTARTKQALQKSGVRDTRRKKKKWQGGMGKWSIVSSAPSEGFFWKWITYPFFSDYLAIIYG